MRAWSAPVEFAGVGWALGLVEKTRGTYRLKLVLPLFAGGVEDFRVVDWPRLPTVFGAWDIEEFGNDVGHALDLFEAGAGFGTSSDEFNFTQGASTGQRAACAAGGGRRRRLGARRQASGHALACAGSSSGDQVDLFDAGFFNAGAHAAGADLLSLCGQVDEGADGNASRQAMKSKPISADRSCQHRTCRTPQVRVVRAGLRWLGTHAARGLRKGCHRRPICQSSMAGVAGANTGS